ncbi:MAG: SPOR domain-containing protein [Deltaproteobacteria bacterium]
MIEKKKYQTVAFFSAFITIFIFAISFCAAASDTLNGVHVIEFNLKEGVVKLYLPDDMAAGDTISASIGVFPKGTSSEEKISNTRALNGYIIETSYVSAPVGQKTFKMDIPRNTAGSSIKFALKDGSMRELSNSRIPVGLSAPGSGRGGMPTPFDYQCPLVGQAGRFVEIRGPFDGDFATTDFRIGSKKPPVLAESPRKLVFETPVDIVGSVDLVLKEREVVVKRPFTCLQVVKIGEGGAVPVSRLDRERSIVEDESPAKSETAPSPGTIQKLEFESIKAEQTLSTVDEAGAAPVSASVTENNEKRLIIARQMGSRFHASAVPSGQASITEEEQSTPPGEIDTAIKLEDESDELAVGAVTESRESMKNGGQDTPALDGRDSKGLIIQAQLAASFTPVAPEKGPGTLSLSGVKGGFTVQVASVKNEEDARTLARKLGLKGYPVFVVTADIPGRGRWYRVRVGSFSTRKEASIYGNSLREKEPLVKSVFTAESD